MRGAVTSFLVAAALFGGAVLVAGDDPAGAQAAFECPEGAQPVGDECIREFWVCDDEEAVEGNQCRVETWPYGRCLAPAIPRSWTSCVLLASAPAAATLSPCDYAPFTHVDESGLCQHAMSFHRSCEPGFRADDSLGGLCVRFEPADQLPPGCPEGSHGEPDDCYILVAKGPGSSDCPEGSSAVGDECRKPVATAPGAYYCSDSDAALSGLNCIYTSSPGWWCELTASSQSEPCYVEIDPSPWEACTWTSGVTTYCSSYEVPQPICALPYAELRGDDICSALFPGACSYPVDNFCRESVPPLSGSEISGRVVSPDGEGLFGLRVCAYRAVLNTEDCTMSGYDGGFAIPVDAGNYQISAIDPAGYRGRSCAGPKGCEEPAIYGVGTASSVRDVEIVIDAYQGQSLGQAEVDDQADRADDAVDAEGEHEGGAGIAEPTRDPDQIPTPTATPVRPEATPGPIPTAMPLPEGFPTPVGPEATPGPIPTAMPLPEGFPTPVGPDTTPGPIPTAIPVPEGFPTPVAPPDIPTVTPTVTPGPEIDSPEELETSSSLLVNVIDANKQPVADAEVCAAASGPVAVLSDPVCGRTDPGGYFFVPQVSPGNYSISVCPDGDCHHAGIVGVGTRSRSFFEVELQAS